MIPYYEANNSPSIKETSARITKISVMNYNPNVPIEANEHVGGADDEDQRPVIAVNRQPLTIPGGSSNFTEERDRTRLSAVTSTAAHHVGFARDTAEDASFSSSSTSDDDSDQEGRKRVSFESVEIIELPFALGDNPSVSRGPPLTTEWEAQHRTTLDLDFFETCRPSRRSGKNLVVSHEDREKLLLEHGFSKQQISEASNEAARARSQRRNQPQERRKKASSLSPPRYSSSTKSLSKSFSQRPPSPPVLLSPVSVTASRGADRWEANSFIPKLRGDGKKGNAVYKKDVLISPQRNSPTKTATTTSDTIVQQRQHGTNKSRTLSPVRNVNTKKINPDLLRIGKSLTMD